MSIPETTAGLAGLQNFLGAADGVARGVFGVLLLMSVATWTIIGVRALQALWQGPRQRRFVARFWQADSIEQVAATLRGQRGTDPFANVVRHGLAAIEQLRSPREPLQPGLDTPDALLTRMLRRGIDEARRGSEFGLGVLASVASSAPFVGLLGTVWGIYQALISIGRSGQGTIDRVAGPIGEALIMTALGLAVAIPAVLAYNVLSRRSRHLAADLGCFAHDVFTLFGSGLKTPLRLDGDPIDASRGER